MRFGLAARLAVIFGALVFVTALLVTVASVLITSDRVHDDIDRFLRDRAEEILGGQRDAPSRDDRRRGDGGEDELAEAVESVDNPGAVDADSEVQSLDVDGEITASIGVTLPVEDIDRELAAAPGKAVYRTVTIDGTEYRMFTAHVTGGGALQVARDLESTNQLLAEIRTMLLVLGVVLALFGAAVGWLVARRTTRPLRSLAASVEQVARTQDLSTPIGLDRTDEIGRLADRFDEMLAALAVSQEQQHQLVQDAAHELRTPLTSINANVELLERAPDLDPEVRQEILTSTRSELDELRTLFTEIIELATDVRHAEPHRRLDLAEVARNAVATFGARSGRMVEVEAVPSPVVGDPVALDRAIANLLSNADKYSPEGEPVTVVVADGRLVVRDRGPGIPAEDRERVFDRFYRSEEARPQPGSGLGLAIVRKVVLDHGGQVAVGELPGGGGEVGFVLPAAPAAAPPT